MPISAAMRCLNALIAFQISSSLAAYGQAPATSIAFSFEQRDSATPADSSGKVQGQLEGNFQYVPGASGTGIRFDGYTTSLTIPAAQLPPLARGFSVESWIALNTYPWDLLPILDQEKAREAGFLLGIDAFGHVSLQASINGQWQTTTSTATVPLKGWVHLVGNYQTSGEDGVLSVWLDGRKVCALPVHGAFNAASQKDLLLGRVRQATLPFPQAEIRPVYPLRYSLDGILDEVRLFPHGRTDDEIAHDSASVKPPQGEVLPWQQMPSGGPGPNRFGAVYASLRYEEPWDRLRKVGPDSDVVVRFKDSPIRLVFWQGLNYVPAWVSENGKWYTDEFLEVWNEGCPDGGDCEPMSDKQERFSRVSILESNDVRAVVHWRYALVEAVALKGAWLDPLTGWFDWADEYWTVYPDGTAIRKQVLHSTHPEAVHEWQETIVLHQPGSRPEDDIRDDAITLANMQGQAKTYRWQPKRDTSFRNPTGPANPALPLPNMQMVNIKSMWKPFQIVPPEGVSADFYNNEKSFFEFECWNHWPVAQIASSDRACVTSDRPSHSSLSHLFWSASANTPDTATKLLLDGLTTKPIAELLPVAKAWLSPPTLEVSGDDFVNEGFDPAERAFVLRAKGQGTRQPLALTLRASTASPLYHPTVLIRGWGDQPVTLRPSQGSSVTNLAGRTALVPRSDTTDLLIGLDIESTSPTRLTIVPGPPSSSTSAPVQH